MNIWDILILALLAAAVGLALKTLRGRKNSGGCACGCEGCTRQCAAKRMTPEGDGKADGDKR